MNLPLSHAKQRGEARYHLGLLLTTTIWAGTFINIKVALLQVPPNTLAFLRFVIASLALGFYIKYKGYPLIPRKDWPRVALCGLTGITLYNFLQNQGLRYAGSTDAAILASMAPVFMALLAWLYLKEKISSRQVAGIIMAFTGSVLVATKGSLASLTLNPTQLLGDFLILITGISWAIYSTSVKKLLDCYPVTSVLAYCTFAGTIFLAPLVLLEYPVNLAAVDFWGWLNIVYMGLMASTLAYLLWNAGLAKVPAVTAGAYLYLLPVIAAVIAAVFLQETPGLFTIVGGLLALVGTYFASK
ncbi:MAG: hypothetical protein JG781_1600 [Peptococcaceae bacterium]|nr:hypothetical protein [Peptococcaceae bacterium]